MLVIGHLIAHTNHELNGWIARVMKIEGNDLHVRISSDTSGQWEEVWNLAHTNAGLQQGEYYILGKCHD